MVRYPEHMQRMINRNPRYTGRQVWNRLRTDEVLIDVDDIALGHENRHRWNDPSDWVWSQIRSSHSPAFNRPLRARSADDQKRGTRESSGAKAPRHTAHPYLFRGLITCGLCERKMVGNPNHGRLYYRCTASRDYVRQQAITHPPTLYLREDSIAVPIDRFLRDELAGPAMTDNLRRVADAQYRAALAAHDPAGEITRSGGPSPTPTTRSTVTGRRSTPVATQRSSPAGSLRPPRSRRRTGPARTHRCPAPAHDRRSARRHRRHLRQAARPASRRGPTRQGRAVRPDRPSILATIERADHR